MRCRWLYLSLGALVALPTFAFAAALTVTPVGLDLPAKQRAGSISLVNNDSEPVSLQIRALKWTQENGEDKVEPTQSVLASPPAATIPAGATYTIRVARLSPVPVTGEESYRLFIDELPKPVDPRTVGSGIAMVLRTSLPVFFANDNAIAKVSWRLWSDASGIHLEGKNSGLRHVRLSAMKLGGPNGQTISFGEGLGGYILAGATKQFVLSADKDKSLPKITTGAQYVLTAKTNTSDLNTPVTAQ